MADCPGEVSLLSIAGKIRSALRSVRRDVLPKLGPVFETGEFRDSPRWLQKHLRTDWLARHRKLTAKAAYLKECTHPILVGPWLSEVGYEVLYWIPFLKWMFEEHRIPPERLCFFSRGGARLWYDSLGPNYLDVFDLVTPKEFRGKNEGRWAEAKTQKH